MINLIKKMKEKKQKEKQERIAREGERRKAREEAERIRKEKRKTIIFVLIGVIAVIILSIICGVGYHNAIEGKIQIPMSSEECQKSFYTDVEGRLKEAGFTNISSEPMNDLTLRGLNKENTVDHISINGDDSPFSTGEYYDPDYKVVIYYHSFLEIEKTTERATETTTQLVTETTTETITKSTTQTTTKKKSSSGNSSSSSIQQSNSKQKHESNSKKTINNNSNSEGTYILNTNSKKFHRPSCKRGPTDTSGNKQESNLSREELIAQGYDPCGYCKP